MSLVAIANALHALAPAGITAHQGEAPGGSTAPWLVTSLESPDSIEGEAATLPVGTYTWRVTVVGSTYLQALGFVEVAKRAWRNQRVTVAGYSIGAIRGPSVTGPYKSGLTATDTDLRYQVAQLRFSLTISEI